MPKMGISPQTDNRNPLIYKWFQVLNRLNLLILGLGFLVLTILLGVLYVRYGLDCWHYNLMGVDVVNELKKFKTIPVSEEKKGTVDLLNRIYKKQQARFERINKIMPFIIPLLTWSFVTV